MCLAVPGKVISIQEGELRMGRVAFGPVEKDASLAFVPQAVVGDYVLIHAGMALEILDEAAARKVFEALRAMEEADPLPDLP
jgi:hydrogenase expression/formation protein HypC